jgi:hypothetical protein
MRRRMALCSTVVGVWIITAGAFGQAAPAQPATQKPGATTAPAATPATTAAPTAAPTATTTAAPATPTGGAAAAPAAGTTTSADGSTSVTSTPPATNLDAGTYAVRLVDLEQRINELKEQVFRSKARLALLAETILQGVVGGSQNLVVLENGMTDTFELVGASFALDGAPIFFRADESGEFGKLPEVDVYNGAIVPGEHTLKVTLELRGRGFGVFSYLQGYHFTLTSSHPFTAPEGKAIKVRVVAYEQGGPMTPINERPNVRFEESESDNFVPQTEQQAVEGAKSVAPGTGPAAPTAPTGDVQGSATGTSTPASTSGSLNVGAGTQGGN